MRTSEWIDVNEVRPIIDKLYLCYTQKGKHIFATYYGHTWSHSSITHYAEMDSPIKDPVEPNPEHLTWNVEWYSYKAGYSYILTCHHVWYGEISTLQLKTAADLLEYMEKENIKYTNFSSYGTKNVYEGEADIRSAKHD